MRTLSPTHLDITVLGPTTRKDAPHSAAVARASSVFPVPANCLVIITGSANSHVEVIEHTQIEPGSLNHGAIHCVQYTLSTAKVFDVKTAMQDMSCNGHTHLHPPHISQAPVFAA